MSYKWCAVPACKNTTIKTPEKLFITVPKNVKVRKKWLQLANRDPGGVRDSSSIFFCEDHFDLEKDMGNYYQYKMGFSQRIIMIEGVLPTKFYCQEDLRKRTSDISSSSPVFVKQQRTQVIQECEDSQMQEVLGEAHIFATTKTNSQVWQPNRNARICGVHFVNGERYQDPRNVSFKPTVFPRKPLKEVAVTRQARLINRNKLKYEQTLKVKDGESKDGVGGKRRKAALTKKSLQSSATKSTSPCSTSPSTSHQISDLQSSSHFLKTGGKEEMSGSEEVDVQPLEQVMIKQEAEDTLDAEEVDVMPFEQDTIKEEIEEPLDAQETDEQPYEDITIKEELENNLNAEETDEQPYEDITIKEELENNLNAEAS